MKSKTGDLKKKARKRRTSIPWIIPFLAIALICTGILEFRWEKSGKSITASQSYVDNPSIQIPDYQGEDIIYLNNNLPCFVEKDVSLVKGENYSPLDFLGRCGTAVAMLDASMMPKEERGSIGQIKPTGWKQQKYPDIIESNPPYLYNRCHLIAYGFTGQNANKENLVTGTRHLNIDIMLPWEKKIMQYLETTGNHVLYRVSPYFEERELVARGIEMEAYSIEDKGEGICFHIFLYNRQSGIEIDYQDGSNHAQ